MNVFDRAFTAASQMGMPVVEVAIMINNVPVVGSVGPVTAGNQRDPERGGKVMEWTLDIELTAAEAAKCSPAKGSRLSTEGVPKARVYEVVHLGGAGVTLRCGPVNREQE